LHYPQAPAVATIVEPQERRRLDVAAEGAFTAIHTETLPEAIKAVRERPVRAVLLSPAYLRRDQLHGVASLIERFPGVPTVAVLVRHDARSSECLLALGASGVRRIVDLSDPEGWRRLRALVSDEASPTAARILTAVIPAMGPHPEDCGLFFQALIRSASGVSTVRRLVQRFGVTPSTFMSRFFRAGLPSPKRYLSSTRLVYAAALFEERGLSIADVAYRLEYSSPQSFGRHLRAMLGMTAGEFRSRYGFDATLQHYVGRLIIPYRSAFRSFHPLNKRGMRRLGHGG